MLADQSQHIAWDVNKILIGMDMKKKPEWLYKSYNAQIDLNCWFQYITSSTLHYIILFPSSRQKSNHRTV